MTVQERINADMKSALKKKKLARKNLLRVVMAEFSRVGKVLTDEDATKVLTKMVKNAKLMKNESEVEILEQYLPTQMDDDELHLEIVLIVDDCLCGSLKDMGTVMSVLKARHGGKYDGKKASIMVKDILGNL